jgi:hypothetical protein
MDKCRIVIPKLAAMHSQLRVLYLPLTTPTKQLLTKFKQAVESGQRWRVPP